jgi:hypothetical protein
MTMPNFLVIGAMKSGTTALYYYLKQHPQVYMSPVKEPNFFAFEGEEPRSEWDKEQRWVHRSTVTNIEAYRALFRRATNEKALGEASHWYLYKPKAVERIKHLVPEAKMIAVLRNPVERAYSHFLHSVRTGTEPLTDFAEALRADGSGARSETEREDYVGRGLYHKQLSRYFDTFDRDQMSIYLYEDFKKAPVETLQDIFRFLEIDKTFTPDVSRKRNVSGYPKSKALDRILRGSYPVRNALKVYLPPRLRWSLSKVYDDLETRNTAKPPEIGPEVKRELIEVFRDDVLKLQELINRDLSAWLDDPSRASAEQLELRNPT